MFLRQVGLYQVYALLLFLVTYLLNQLDRYMLAITIRPITQELHFGDQGCMSNKGTNLTDDELDKLKCGDYLQENK